MIKKITQTAERLFELGQFLESTDKDFKAMTEST